MALTRPQRGSDARYLRALGPVLSLVRDLDTEMLQQDSDTGEDLDVVPHQETAAEKRPSTRFVQFGDMRRGRLSPGRQPSNGTPVSRGGTIPEITMRYVSRYLSHDTIRITILH